MRWSEGRKGRHESRGAGRPIHPSHIAPHRRSCNPLGSRGPSPSRKGSEPHIVAGVHCAACPVKLCVLRWVPGPQAASAAVPSHEAGEGRDAPRALAAAHAPDATNLAGAGGKAWRGGGAIVGHRHHAARMTASLGLQRAFSARLLASPWAGPAATRLLRHWAEPGWLGSRAPHGCHALHGSAPAPALNDNLPEEVVKRDGTVLRRPEEPDPHECCGRGCEFCVWTVYYEDLQAYQRAVAAEKGGAVPAERDAFAAFEQRLREQELRGGR